MMQRATASFFIRGEPPAKTGGGAKGLRHPTTNWLRQSVPRPSKGGQKGILPHHKESAQALLSALQRAGDHAEHGGGMLE